MERDLDRRRFLSITGISLGFGALYAVGPRGALAKEGDHVTRRLAEANGEAPGSFSFVQLSDTHVGFQSPQYPGGTAAFELAIQNVNALPKKPDLVLFTGDLTHDSEDKDEHARRMRTFRDIASRLDGPVVKAIPGEHDAGLDGGALFREHFGETSYSFDHRGVHFVALDNVSRARPEVGAERIAWLEQDLGRFQPTAPIVVFTHRPLFDLKPEWEWFTRDGDQVLEVLAPFENVTVLYGHIHRAHHRVIGHTRHDAARSLVFSFPDPDATDDKKPVPYDGARPYAGLGLRVVRESVAGEAPASLDLDDVELTQRTFSGTEGFVRLLRRRAV